MRNRLYFPAPKDSGARSDHDRDSNSRLSSDVGRPRPRSRDARRATWRRGPALRRCVPDAEQPSQRHGLPQLRHERGPRPAHQGARRLSQVRRKGRGDVLPLRPRGDRSRGGRVVRGHLRRRRVGIRQGRAGVASQHVRAHQVDDGLQARSGVPVPRGVRSAGRRDDVRRQEEGLRAHGRAPQHVRDGAAADEARQGHGVLARRDRGAHAQGRGDDRQDRHCRVASGLDQGSQRQAPRAAADCRRSCCRPSTDLRQGRAARHAGRLLRRRAALHADR